MSKRRLSTTTDLLQTAGKLYWYRHDGWEGATSSWTGREIVGTAGWEKMKFVFATSEHVIYAINEKGELWWYKALGFDPRS